MCKIFQKEECLFHISVLFFNAVKSLITLINDMYKRNIFFINAIYTALLKKIFMY